MNMNNKHTTREPDLFELCGLSVYLSVFKRLADKEGFNGSWEDFPVGGLNTLQLSTHASKSDKLGFFPFPKIHPKTISRLVKFPLKEYHI